MRCLWEGSIRQDLSVSLVIGMLAQEVVTFNGDTGKARLDIQVSEKNSFLKRYFFLQSILNKRVF